MWYLPAVVLLRANGNLRCAPWRAELSCVLALTSPCVLWTKLMLKTFWEPRLQYAKTNPLNPSPCSGSLWPPPAAVGCSSLQADHPQSCELPTTLLCNPSARGGCAELPSLLSLAGISLSLSVLIALPGTWPASSTLLFAHQSFHQNTVIYTVIYTEKHPHGLPRQQTNYQIICEF